MDSVVELKDLFFYRDERPIFRGVDFKVPEGKIVGVLGPSGCGKTTLLNLMTGMLKPSQGSISLFSQCVDNFTRDEWYDIRRSLGMLFQNGALFTNLTAFENVAFPLRLHTNLPESMIRDCVMMKLHAVGLRGAHALMPSELSGGMARRVALARAIAMDPKLILYDEPFAGLDPITKAVTVKLIGDLNKVLGMTTILVSHDLQETMEISDYIYVMNRGLVMAEGTPEALLTSESDEVKQFMHGLADGPVPFHHPISKTETWPL